MFYQLKRHPFLIRAHRVATYVQQVYSFVCKGHLCASVRKTIFVKSLDWSDSSSAKTEANSLEPEALGPEAPGPEALGPELNSLGSKRIRFSFYRRGAAHRDLEFAAGLMRTAWKRNEPVRGWPRRFSPGDPAYLRSD
jgi:hypothetical protein